MKNFIFISPNFPTNYWMFCRELKRNGLNVLGIGDQAYEELNPDLKNSLNEYYKVSSLENYDEVYRAVAFFTFKYGRIDWLESNNEYWLERDAHLRTDFNITSGFQVSDIPRIKYKSKMKEFYQKAGIPVARYHLTTTIEEGRKFIEQVGYPVVVKPDNGVGATNTWKLKNDADLEWFYAHQPENQYIMEEFIDGEVATFDGVVNSKGEVLFAVSHVSPGSIMDSVNSGNALWYYVDKDIPDNLRSAGERTLKAFGIKSRCFHMEFFRLNVDKEGLGKKGDIVGLEVNMRPAGGVTPHMINFAASNDMYAIYADMIAYDTTSRRDAAPRKYCVYVSRRDSFHYAHSDVAVKARYGSSICMAERMPGIFAEVLGDSYYIIKFDDFDSVLEAVRYIDELA